MVNCALTDEYVEVVTTDNDGTECTYQICELTNGNFKVVSHTHNENRNQPSHMVEFELPKEHLGFFAIMAASANNKFNNPDY